MFDFIGKTIGAYRIVEQVGAGGMATVYKAYQSNMDRYVAVKVLPMQLANDPEFQKRFQREAHAIARLEHAHILPVYDYGKYEGITFIAMRYIEAGTLKDQMSTGVLSLEKINHIVGQIGSALNYAHRMGVIHRDVKPGNVLIDSQGDIYLSDFGLARMMEPSQKLTASGVGLGTPAYMSPEQGQGIKIDHRSDIYSLGIILYEMVTGRVPFEAETPMAVVLKHITDPLPLPRTINPNVSEQVELVILKALAKDPADRYQTAGEMVQALNDAVFANRMEAPQHLTTNVKHEHKNLSIITRLQRSWERPHGRILLIGSTLIVFIALGLWLSRLSGSIIILSPGPAVTTNAPAQPTSTTAAYPAASPTVTTAIISSTSTPESANLSISGTWEQVYDGSSFLPVAINALAVDPNDVKTIYAGTIGAGIYISRDGGETWNVSNEGLGKGTVGSIVIDPKEINTVYAALMDAGGVYKSTDGGKTWSSSNFGIILDNEDPWLALIYLAPSNNQKLYFTSGPGMYKSTDGGSSWYHQIDPDQCPFSLNQLVVDPSNEDHLYAATKTSITCIDGIYESFDGGRSWSLLTTAEMEKSSGDIWRLAIDLRNPEIIYAGSNASTFKSTNGGRTWEIVRQDRCEWLAVHPDDGTVYCEQQGFVQISRDGGLSWQRTRFGSAQGSGWDRSPYAFVPETQTLYVGSDTVMRSNDGGQTWEYVTSFDLPRMQLSVDMHNSNRLYLGGWLGTNMDRPCEAYRSDDGGDNWQTIVADFDGSCLITLDKNSSSIFRAGGWSNTLYKSEDGGNAWQQLRDGLPRGIHDLTQLLVPPNEPARLWLLNDGDTLYLSDDGGISFDPTEGVENIWQSILLVDSSGQNLYLLSRSTFYRSQDGGKTWQIITNPGGYYLAGEADPLNPEVVYIGSTHRGIYKSMDGGQSWSQLVNLPATSINDIAIDPYNTQIVYTATNNGAFISKNGGEAWTHLQDGLGPNPIVYSIAIDPNYSSKVYAATPDGVYRFVKSSDLSQQPLTPDLALEAATRSAEADPDAGLVAAILHTILNQEPSYQDDFSDPTRGFGENHEGGGYARNNNGVYLMEAPKNGYSTSWSGTEFFPHSDLAVQLDMRLDAFQNDYPRDGQIFLHWSPAIDYGFEVNYDGPMMQYQLGIHQSASDYKYLAERRPFHPATDTQVGTWHNIIAIVKGNQLAYFIDGVLVASVTDDTIASGSFLVGAGPGTAMQVDNLRIWDISGMP